MAADPMLDAMAAKQRRVAMIMWVIAGCVVAGTFVLYVTRLQSTFLLTAGLAVSGGFAGLARSAQRRAHFARDGDSTDDLDLDF